MAIDTRLPNTYAVAPPRVRVTDREPERAQPRSTTVAETSVTGAGIQQAIVAANAGQGGTSSHPAPAPPPATATATHVGRARWTVTRAGRAGEHERRIPAHNGDRLGAV